MVAQTPKPPTIVNLKGNGSDGASEPYRVLVTYSDGSIEAFAVPQPCSLKEIVLLEGSEKGSAKVRAVLGEPIRSPNQN